MCVFEGGAGSEKGIWKNIDMLRWGMVRMRVVGIGKQDFEKVRVNNNFYIDKTGFIREWWESGDDVTLLTRPRRFGKTLNMSMLEKFFSVDYARSEEHTSELQSPA